MQSRGLAWVRWIGAAIGMWAGVALAAPAAWAGPPQESAEEEDYYRQEDPDAPGAPKAPPPDGLAHTFTLSGVYFVGLDTGMGAEDDGSGFEVRWLWSPFDAWRQVRFEVGLDAGWIAGQSYGEGPHTPAAFVESSEVGDLNFALVPTHPFTQVIADLEWIYGGITGRLDFTGPQELDTGIALSLRVANVQVDAQWYCTDCSGSGPGNETSDFSETNVAFRLGAYVAYQVEWFTVGFDVGVQFFLQREQPMSLGIDVALTLGAGF